MLDGKRIYENVNGNALTALQKARTRTAQDKHARTINAARDSLRQAIQHYIENRKQHRKYEAAENARHVLNEFATICPVESVKLIRLEHLSAFCAALHERGQSDRTVSNKYNRLRSFLKFAGRDIKLSKDDRPKFEKKLPTIYTKEETDSLLANADEYMQVAISLGLRLGLREQEMMHAEWGDVDRAHKVFRVQSKPHYGFTVKDKEQREVPIPTAVLTLLSTWHKKRPNTTLILGIGKKHDRANGHLLRWLQRVAKHAGIADATLHRLRRTYMTTLLRNGVDIRSAQAFAGHSDLQSTMRYLTPASAKEMQEKIDAIQF